MAVVTGPLHSSEARGSVGSLQYNSWRGRATVRTRSGPAIADQYTENRIALRGMAAVATLEWQAMSDTERAQWNEYARSHIDSDWTGSGKRLTGYNWFIRINVRRQLIGVGTDRAVPTETVTVVLTNLTVVVQDVYPYVQWESAGEYDTGTTGVEIWMTEAHSAGANPTRKQAKRIDVVSLSASQYLLTITVGLWYTVFLRPILINGVVGSWASIKFQAPAV